jgi:hypothetical protein
MKFDPNRRVLLKAAGVSMALPALEALSPRSAFAAAPVMQRRMVCMCAPLGIHAPNFIPEQAGRDYALPAYLELIKDYRDDFTVISGLCHPGVAEGHDSGYSFLTGAHHKGFMRGGFRNTISLDQLAAEQIGTETRFPSLSMSTEGFGLSWTRSGVQVPSEMNPNSVFGKLFLEGSPEQVKAQVRRLRYGQSILDNVGDQAKTMSAALSDQDRDKLDEYFTSVRELEKRLASAEQWSKKPKPQVDAPAPENPRNEDLIARTKAWLDLTHLALQSDSTRLVTILLNGTTGAPLIQGVSQGHHDLSHHGQDPGKLDQLRIVENEQMKVVGEFLGKLKQTENQAGNLLDQTMVYLGSNLGNASSHSTKNLPILIAGGGFQHGQHLAFDPDDHPPLCNLYFSMLQRMGVEVDRFGSSTGTLSGLDFRP